MPSHALTEVVRALDAGFPDDFPDLADAYLELAACFHDEDRIRALRERAAAIRLRLQRDGASRAIDAQPSPRGPGSG